MSITDHDRLQFLLNESFLTENEDGQPVYRIDIPTNVSMISHQFHGVRIPSLLELIDSNLKENK